MTELSYQEIPKDRNVQRLDFIRKIGWQDAEIQILFADAGSRGYFRLTKNDQSAMLMDMPFKFLKLEQYLLIGGVLKKAGIRTPDIYETDLEKGFALIEDFGDRVYSTIYDEGVDKMPYFEKAIDVLIHLHQNINLSPLEGKLTHDITWYMQEVPSFIDWYLPARNGFETPPDIAADYKMMWRSVLENMPPLPKMLSMIDYHAPNLLDLIGEEGINSVGIIDFQDGVLTSPAYDVMSLLEDDRRDLEPDIRVHILNRYFDAMGETYDREVFELHMAILGAQRHAKNMGNFLRIVVQKHQDRFLDYVPVATNWFHQCIQHPELEQVRKWFEKQCPDYLAPLTDIRKFK